ncbi:TPA: phosphoenolpyruvate carboxykinase (GTP) [Candidatus Poribacteria bacterium]|nr:phosphoenolpyruvate carboxykinase (GTP) [Candidatus Poribacteria bacterium]
MDNVLNDINLSKLSALKNEHVSNIVEKYIRLCQPAKVTVITDAKEDIDYVRKLAIQNKEESPLAIEGHTIHFDGYFDQARDRANTRVLLPEGEKLSKSINTIDRETGLSEMMKLLDGIMTGKEMLVCFFCLGPNNSKFSIPALQITDSAYVAHSETILYRSGYKDFQDLNGSDEFFHFIHSAGELDENGNSKNIAQRRIYIDLEEERILTVNNQYAGNSVGLKKLALRLAISKANREGWLCEHMFIMGVHPTGPNGRVTYFAGAFPSACGKTSTAMIPGQSIIGDDIAYIRAGEDGVAYAANVEQGIFGIIRDINPTDDPVIYEALTTPRELIFSNVLIVDGTPYWLGMGKELPSAGINFSGEWEEGKVGSDGKEVPPAHPNARYTIGINELENANPNLHHPDGVPLSAVIYGGRDSDTNPAVVESLSWSHGVFIGAALESETTSATIGEEGIRIHDSMANMDFLVIPLGTYITNHFKFGEVLDKPPKIFSTNYFLKEDGKFLNEKVDKKVWLLWMEGRVHSEYNAIETPIGYIPRYPDLKSLFSQIFDREYTKEEYEKQFSIRVTKLLERLERIEKIYNQEDDVPKVFHRHIAQQRKRLNEAKLKHKKDVISPFDLGE